MSRNCSRKNSPRRRRGRRGSNGMVKMPILAPVNDHFPGDLDVPAVQRLLSLVVSRRGRVRCLRFAHVLLTLALALAVTSTVFADSGVIAQNSAFTDPGIIAYRAVVSYNAVSYRYVHAQFNILPEHCLIYRSPRSDSAAGPQNSRP